MSASGRMRAKSRRAGAAIAALMFGDDACAGRAGARGSGVGRAVVDDDDFVDPLRQHLAHDVRDR